MDELDDAILQYEHFDAECARLDAAIRAANEAIPFNFGAYDLACQQFNVADIERAYWAARVDELEQEVAYRNLREDRRDYYDSVL